jgi:hypothetical protein
MTQLFSDDVHIQENLQVDKDVAIDGQLRIGSSDMGQMATEDALVEVHRNPDDIQAPKRGLHLLGAIQNMVQQAISWVVHELELRGSDDIVGKQTAMRVKLTHDNTGDVSQAQLIGTEIEVDNLADSSVSGTAVGQMVGLDVHLHNTTDAQVTEAVGLSVGMTNDGTISDSYAIRTTGGGKIQSDSFPSKGVVQVTDDGILERLPYVAGMSNRFLGEDGQWQAVATENHTHDASDIDSSGATEGQVLTADGSNGASWTTLDNMGGGILQTYRLAENVTIQNYEEALWGGALHIAPGNSLTIQPGGRVRIMEERK